MHLLSLLLLPLCAAVDLSLCAPLFAQQSMISRSLHLFYNIRPLFLSLPSQLSVALEEKLSLQAETRTLKEKLSRCDSLDASTTAITGKKLLLLQSQIEQLQEENYRYKL